ncbi:MAG: hypothetical protein J6A89_02385 [Clostridia bacterium]|nr:hypothetical protein [Clostridia bacterium]
MEQLRGIQEQRKIQRRSFHNISEWAKKTKINCSPELQDVLMELKIEKFNNNN